MDAKLRVTFEAVAGGWIRVRLRSGNATYEDEFSYIKYDSLREVCDALLVWLSGVDGTVARWYGEPGEMEMTFGRTAEGTSGKVTVTCHKRPGRGDGSRRTVVFEYVGPVDHVARAFWRGLRKLQRAPERCDWERNYPYGFPDSTLDRLRAGL